MRPESLRFEESVTRRHFIRQAASVALLASLKTKAADGSELKSVSFRAAIIGHTGCGDYGHDHDLIFNPWPNLKVVAVADADSTGRARAAARSHAPRAYSDYRQMLAKEKPELVCVAPRWTREHHAMALAALQAGAHIYLEKPITQSLSQADELLSVARRSRRRIVVAHQVRLADNILALKCALEAGLFGELLELRSHGKQDHRAGGEDLIVLGVHLFDLMRLFAGDPLWCTARVLTNGQDITLRDVHSATEDIGPVAGNEVTVQFAFSARVSGIFVSDARFREISGPWGLELIGTKGRARIEMAMRPKILVQSSDDRAKESSSWKEFDAAAYGAQDQRDITIPEANQRVMKDWLGAIVEDRDPVCSGYAGMKALEMALAVFAAGLSRTRVALPMADRDHPLRPGSPHPMR